MKEPMESDTFKVITRHSYKGLDSLKFNGYSSIQER
jgi:hypothetical protein